MPFQKGHQKFGGRSAGEPRKIKLALSVSTRLEELGFDPIEHAHKLIQDEKTPVAVAAKLTSDLLEFIYARRKSVEHTGLDGAPLHPPQITVRFIDPRIPSGDPSGLPASPRLSLPAVEV